MKTLTLSTLLLCSTAFTFAQNINDNKVSFSYTQLPLIKINKAFKKYEIRTNHAYLQANEDSLELFEIRQEAAEDSFRQAQIRYQGKRDSIDRAYLMQMASWEKRVNSGATGPNGTPLPQPAPPLYPDAPMMQQIDAPIMHSEFDNSIVSVGIAIEGFEEGLGGFLVNVEIMPIRDIRVSESRKGTGASTKYQYTAHYTMPISIKIETPTDGTILETVLLEGSQSYKMKEQKSKYDHQLYMMDNKAAFYADLERTARQKAMNNAKNYINNQIGYVKKTRSTEIYSLKKFKNYDYSDVTNAYSSTVQALAQIIKERDRSSAQEKLAVALKLWEEIMMESNTYDNKARINDKVSAVIQCNIAEIKLWQSKFSEAEAMLNLAENSGVLKAKNHARRNKGYYGQVKQRWEVNY